MVTNGGIDGPVTRLSAFGEGKGLAPPFVSLTCLILNEFIEKLLEHTSTTGFSSPIKHKKHTFVLGFHLPGIHSSLLFSDSAQQPLPPWENINP